MSASRKTILLLGGARSGKSTLAQKLAGQMGNKVLFVATGEPLDEEMKTRIEEHKKSRPKNWKTLEAPQNIGKALIEQTGDAEVIIIDCLTLLVSNLLKNETDYPEAEKQVLSEINELISIMKASRIPDNQVRALDYQIAVVCNQMNVARLPHFPYISI